MAKGKDPNEEFYQFISQMKDMVENMSEKERGEFKKVMMSEAGLAELENEKFYTYQRPDYASKAAKEIDWQWLAPFWHVEPDDDKLELCEFVERDGQNMKMTRKQQREELRGYMYLLFSRFEPEQHENRWRLYGPLKSEEHIVLLSGQGSYPAQSIRNMAEYTRRYEQGKLKNPNFDAIRMRIREFEEENDPIM